MLDFIAKPVDPDHLFTTLLKWLSGKHAPAPLAEKAQREAPAKPAPGGTPDDVPENLPGLDIQAGLKTWRDAAVYRKFLCKFAADYAGSARNIAGVLSGGDPKGAAALAHKLKGAAGNLALAGVARLAAEIERKLKAGEDAGGPLAQLQASLDEALDSIGRYAPGETGDASSPAQDIDRARVATLLHGLLKALDADDPGQAEPVLEALSTLLPADRLGAVRAALDNFDFREAETAARKLAKGLGIVLD